MSLSQLVEIALDKTYFVALENYFEFCKKFLEFTETGLQATIVAQNENNYRFYQYKDDGFYQITRPLNSNLMVSNSTLSELDEFIRILAVISEISPDDELSQKIIIKSIYSVQQSIGATLDALPPGASNKARKINGDLFERLIKLLMQRIGVSCETGTVRVPVYVDNELQFKMNYQHDLLVYKEDQLKIIGSVKTTSKDRIDKIFLDKFLYSKLTETSLPHIAIFLNDVQRTDTKRIDQYSISSTFLPGRFKGYTIKLNPLDGVYYCDIRPNMQRDEILKRNIKTIDQLFLKDVWNFLEKGGMPLSEVDIEKEP